MFTRREVVEFIIDLVGYVADRLLHKRWLLEPTVGRGDFRMPAADRLLTAYGRAVPVGDLGTAKRLFGDTAMGARCSL